MSHDEECGGKKVSMRIALLPKTGEVERCGLTGVFGLV